MGRRGTATPTSSTTRSPSRTPTATASSVCAASGTPSARSSTEPSGCCSGNSQYWGTSLRSWQCAMPGDRRTHLHRTCSLLVDHIRGGGDQRQSRLCFEGGVDRGGHRDCELRGWYVHKRFGGRWLSHE